MNYKWIILSTICLLNLATSPAQQSNPGTVPGVTVQDLQRDPTQLQQFIVSAYQSGAKTVTIPPGIYRLNGAGQDGVLQLEGLKDFEIDAKGVTIVATDNQKVVLDLKNCDHVTLVGGTFTRNPFGFSQGTIEEISADRLSLDVRITKGYPSNPDQPSFFGNAPKILGLFDAQTRDWIKGAGDINFKGIKRLKPDLFRFKLFKALPGDYPIAVGNLVAWRGLFKDGVIFIGCQNLKIIGITVCGSGGFTIHEWGGEGNNHYYGCRIIRGPAPEGADPNDTPLFSSSCDGYHSSSVRNGPTYENCYIEFNDDDAFAIQGKGSLVTASDGASITVGQVGNGDDRIGDTLRLYDETGAWVDDARIVDITPLPDYVCPQVPPKEFRIFNELATHKGFVFQQVKLDHAVRAGFMWIAVDANVTGSGFVIRNCKTYHNRERGMLIKGSNGLIENSIVDGPTSGGIVLCPEIGYWDEADFARNMIIRNNIIRDVALWDSSMGALNISEWRHNAPVPLPGGHRDITIEGNTFADNDGTNIIIGSAQRVTIHQNHFINPMQNDKPLHGLWGSQPSNSLYWITESKDIDTRDNDIVNPGPYMKTLIKTTGSTENIK